MPRYLLVLAAAPLVMGCGTMANVEGRSLALMGLPDREPRPFGGVANDLRWVREQTGLVVAPEDPWAVPANMAATCYFGVVDLPLSLVGDIFTLPKLIRGGREAHPTSSGVAEPAATPDPARPLTPPGPE